MLTGERIKQHRELRNYTQTYVAGKLGISQSVYSKIENGKSRIFGKRAKQIVAILEIEERDTVREGLDFSSRLSESRAMGNESLVYELRDKLNKVSKDFEDLKKCMRDMYKIVLEINAHNREL